MLDRLELLIDEKVNKIKEVNVLIVGLGGVGGYVVENLVRSGIINITIVDPDIIEISNLNRQLIATMESCGQYKVDAWEKRIKLINPDCKVNKRNIFVTKDNINSLFGMYDYVVDACDTVEAKLALIEKCNDLNIKIIVSCGTGNKLDPTRLKITDIYKTKYDPLARILRRECKKMGIKKLTVVSSDEEKYTSISKSIPSCAFVPATAGLFIASFIVNDIIGD